MKIILFIEFFCGFFGILLEIVILWYIVLDNMVEDNVVYFKNLILVIKRFLCFEFIKVKYIEYMYVIYF